MFSRPNSGGSRPSSITRSVRGSFSNGLEVLPPDLSHNIMFSSLPNINVNKNNNVIIDNNIGNLDSSSSSSSFQKYNSFSSYENEEVENEDNSGEKNLYFYKIVVLIL